MSTRTGESREGAEGQGAEGQRGDGRGRGEVVAGKGGEDSEVEAPEDYEFIRTIGDGSFGKVKLGVHRMTREKVAIKILFKERIKEKTDIERISRQIKIMKVIRHPFLVQTYEIIEAPRYLFLVMEYVEGGDLFDAICSSSKLSEELSRQYFSQMILGLEYLHSQGITHRDMKPENVLIGEYGRIKIADFGLGDFFKEGEKLREACGSPCYAPPQMLNQQQYDPRKVDIWSSGVILYAMLHGYLPFEDEVQSLLYQKIKTKNVRVASSVGIPCRNLLRGLLIKDQKERWGMETIKQHEFLAEEVLREQAYVEMEVNEINNMEEFRQICEFLGIREEDHNRLLNSIKKNKHNNLTTLYYLGRKKLLREIVENAESTLTKDVEDKVMEQQPGKQVQDGVVMNPLSISERKPFSFIDKGEASFKFEQKDSSPMQKQKQKQGSSYMQIQKNSSQIESNLTQSIQQSQSSLGHYNAETPSSPNEAPVPRHPPKQFLLQSVQQQKKQAPKKIETKAEKIPQPVLPPKIVKTNVKIPSQASPMNRNVRKDSESFRKGQKQDKLIKGMQKGYLKKSERMPIHKPKEELQKINQAQVKLYERSHSKDRPIVLKNNLRFDKNAGSKNKKQEVLQVTCKQTHIEPHLVDAERIVFISADNLCQNLSKRGYVGRIQYYCYNKQCVLVTKCQLKGIKAGAKQNELQRIIQEINQLNVAI